MYSEAVIERVWRCTRRQYSSEFGHALGGRDRVYLRDAPGGRTGASLKIHLEAVIERVWRYTWRPLSSEIGRVLGGGRWTARRVMRPLFISLLTGNRGNVTMWLYLWALKESWLMAVDRAGRYAGSWSYIQGSTPNHENEGKTNNLGWMLYSVYAVLGVNSWSWHEEIERDDLTLCSVMMVDLWTRREIGDEDDNVVEDTSGYEKSGVWLAWLGWEDLVSV